MGVDGDAAAETLAVLLTKNKTLASLSLEGCELGSSGSSMVCAALSKNKSVRSLNLAVSLLSTRKV